MGYDWGMGLVAPTLPLSSIRLTKEECQYELTEKDKRVNRVLMNMAEGGRDLIEKIKKETLLPWPYPHPDLDPDLSGIGGDVDRMYIVDGTLNMNQGPNALGVLVQELISNGVISGGTTANPPVEPSWPSKTYPTYKPKQYNSLTSRFIQFDARITDDVRLAIALVIAWIIM